MKRKQKSNPSFFQKLTADDFTHRLQLPLDFVRKHCHILPKKAKLRSCSSGGTWEVKIEQTDRYGKCVCFTKGWPKFVKDQKLEAGGYVVFWLNKDGSTFDVAAYEKHGTEKEIPGRDFRVKSEPESESGDEEDDQIAVEQDYVSDENLEIIEDLESSESEAEFDNPYRPSFEVLLKAHHTSRLSLRNEFIQRAGLIRRRAVVLEYAPTQRSSAVILDQQASRLDIAWGWNEFQRQNGLACGKTYSFVFNEARNVIQVRPVDNNLPNETQRGKKRKSPDARKSDNNLPNETQWGKKRKSPYARKSDGGKQNLAFRRSLNSPGSSSKIRRTVDKEGSKAYQTAKAFRERNMVQRSSFVSLMQPSYFQLNVLTIPMSIVKDTYHREANEIELRVSNGKKWPVSCKCAKLGARLSCGWGSFTEDNRLKVGDACAFEVNRSNKFVWDVTIFRC